MDISFNSSQLSSLDSTTWLLYIGMGIVGFCILIITIAAGHHLLFTVLDRAQTAFRRENQPAQDTLDSIVALHPALLDPAGNAGFGLPTPPSTVLSEDSEHADENPTPSESWEGDDDPSLNGSDQDDAYFNFSDSEQGGDGSQWSASEQGDDSSTTSGSEQGDGDWESSTASSDSEPEHEYELKIRAYRQTKRYSSTIQLRLPIP